MTGIMTREMVLRQVMVIPANWLASRTHRQACAPWGKVCREEPTTYAILCPAQEICSHLAISAMRSAAIAAMKQAMSAQKRRLRLPASIRPSAVSKGATGVSP